VGPRATARREGGVASEVHDAPRAALPHARADDAAAEVDAAEIRREDIVPLVELDLEERAELRSRGVVDEHLDVVELRDELLP